mmetsp:Transcript_21538/g.60753  ORF Transcript_21538/g.60753 Transcript_21538/m.60753 type:complete len:210 (-) Transcript_21538:614-1243(-)
MCRRPARPEDYDRTRPVPRLHGQAVDGRRLSVAVLPDQPHVAPVQHRRRGGDAGRARGADPRLRREGRQGGHVDQCPLPAGGVGAVHRTGMPRADHRSHQFTTKGPGGGARPAVADRRGGVGPRAGRGLPAIGTALQPGAEPADPVRRHRPVGPANRGARRLLPADGRRRHPGAVAPDRNPRHAAQGGAHPGGIPVDTSARPRRHTSRH